MIEDAGLGDAVDLQILNTVLAAHLWLPFSLIELAFRNAADRAITAASDRGEDWLLTKGRAGSVLVAREVAGPAFFHGQRDDGTLDDPIAMAARMADRQLGRDEISRDDLIAHLMLGFWVVRAPAGLEAGANLPVFSLIASRLEHPLNNTAELSRVMVNHVLRTRNRVAHHEPLLFRAKHVFTRKGEPKAGAGLVTSLLGAIEKFVLEAELTVNTARTLAPMATMYVDPIPVRIRNDVEPVRERLASELAAIKRSRDEKRAARRE